MHPDEMLTDPRCPLVFKVFQSLVQADATSRLYNAQQLRELATRDDVEVINSHNPYYWDRARATAQSVEVGAQ